jgi:hypothetical protein
MVAGNGLVCNNGCQPYGNTYYNNNLYSDWYCIGL